VIHASIIAMALALSAPVLADTIQPLPHLRSNDEGRCTKVGNNPECLAEMAKIDQSLNRIAQYRWDTADADTARNAPPKPRSEI
jgi:hypothetical protein